MYNAGFRATLVALTTVLLFPWGPMPAGAQDRPLGSEIEREREETMEHHAREMERLAREMERHRREMERHAADMNRALMRAHGDSGEFRVWRDGARDSARFLYRASMRTPCARMGISFSGEDTIVVREVMPNSGAAEAGVQPGDVIVSVDGDRATGRRMSELSESMEAGDRIRLGIRRAGAERTIDVTAREDICPFRTMVSHLPVRLMCLSTDSAGADEEDCVHTRMSMQRLGDELQALQRDLAWRIQTEESDSGVWLRFRSSEGPGDSMFIDLDSVRVMTEGLTLQLDSIARVLPFVYSMSDSMARALPRFRFEVARQAEEAAHAHDVMVRSLALGSRALAGAQLTDLNDELAEYFQAESGALVTDVEAETPAARAGLRAGDVIVAVNGTAVDDVSAVRRHASGHEDGLELSVIRRGERRTIRLNR